MIATAAALAAATAAAPHRPAAIVAREQEDVRVLLALRAIGADALLPIDRARLAGLERGNASRLRVALRVAMGQD